MPETMATRQAPTRAESALRLIGSGVLTLLALLLSFLAFHDVHAGESDLTNEYTILVASAIWIVIVAVQLVRDRRRAVGLGSLAALAILIWLARDAGPAAPTSVARDLIAAAVFAWFIVLSTIRLRTGLRALSDSDRHSAE